MRKTLVRELIKRASISDDGMTISFSFLVGKR